MKGFNIWIKLVNISLDFYIFLLKKMVLSKYFGII
jgi:hypothetical protein